MTCSHQWRDLRLVDQTVQILPLAPSLDPLLPLDGKPRKHMQYGETYRCANSKITQRNQNT